MKHILPGSSNILLFLAIITVALLSGCSDNSDEKVKTNMEVSTSNPGKAHIDTLLTRFDSLDFQVYSNQKWEDLHISHTDDILVHYPDGHTTKGLHDHIEELKPMFVFAPDTKITEHPVKFGSGEWTSVIGTMEGTFSQPMPIGNGKTIPSSGKRFHLQMSTVGHWREGKMIEEYLFWDNQGFMKQIGIGQ